MRNPWVKPDDQEQSDGWFVTIALLGAAVGLYIGHFW